MNSYVEYLEKNYPDLKLDRILDYACISRYELADPGHWFSQKQHNRFHEGLVVATQNPDIAREAGRYISSSKASGVLRQYIFGLLSPMVGYWMMDKIVPTLSRHITVKTEKLAENKVKIRFSPKLNVREEPFQCENRLGMLESLAQVFTKKYPDIEHPECIHKGNERCTYVISWEREPSRIWKQIGLFFFLSAMVTSLALHFFLSTTSWALWTLSLIALSMSVFLYSGWLEKKFLSETLESQGNAADQLINQTNRSYNELLLIQEIGQATSNILDIDHLLAFIMETLQKRLDFDRGMIMLANKERTKLVYTVGYGYTSEYKDLLMNATFSLDKPQSQGQFVQTFKKQKPFLINDLKDVEPAMSPRSIDFAKRLGVKAFISVPIVYEGKSEGILAVDSPRLDRTLNQSDINLLMGIAPQIGISLNNARSYQLMREREESFRALSENAPDIIYTLDITGMFTYVNPAWEKILGHSKEEVEGKYFIEFARKEDADVYIDLFKQVRNERKTITSYNGVLLHKKGSQRLFHMNGAPNFDSEGNATGLVGILKDITEHHAMEAELRQGLKMQAIGTLSAGIAHDFNNILTPIIGYTELIMSENPQENQTKWMMERILNASHRAKELVQQILTFSRQTERERKPVRLSLIIKEALRLLRASLPTTIEMRQNIASDSLVVGDPTQIQQVLMNLCANAGHALQEKGGILEISLVNVDLDDEDLSRQPNTTADSYVRLTVSDTGHGMTPEVLERIFDPFFTTKERAKGTGMGLAVVHGIVESHNGIISVSSEPGKGTKFSAYFPVFIDDTNETTGTVHPPPEGNERILLIDDEPSVVQTEKHVLETLGYDVTTETDSTDALDLFRGAPDRFDLVITDMTMPIMTGDRLAKEMLHIRPDIPIIMCTGYSALINKEQAEAMGIRAYVMKPITKREIAHVIRTALSQDVAR
jgi:PAS domain S-box-containing protein